MCKSGLTSPDVIKISFVSLFPRMLRESRRINHKIAGPLLLTSSPPKRNEREMPFDRIQKPWALMVRHPPNTSNRIDRLGSECAGKLARTQHIETGPVQKTMEKEIHCDDRNQRIYCPSYDVNSSFMEITIRRECDWHLEGNTCACGLLFFSSKWILNR